MTVAPGARRAPLQEFTMTTSSPIRSSSQIRKDFLDFFKSKGHTIVPSSSLMPDSPNLLFTNAGMNQFVPIFLGQRKPDVNTWAGAIVGSDTVATRAADTQKCIRAGGKHNDLDDVGLDTYHHTFFEMLGNWSFGDYFKKDAIDWAWELVVGIWKFPPQRLYATVYNPDKSQNDPSEFDQEAWNFWAEKFRSVGLDPAVHIVNGNKKDNFWMMGETGPCGPCSEIHVDLTPVGDTKGSLVNKGDPRCIEIWNLVFIQFNANPDGTFSPLPAKHVDTGMGFERVSSIIQGTKNLTDFVHAKISNYETDIFRPIFDALERMSRKKYTSTLPGPSFMSTPQVPDAPLKTSGEAPSNIIEVEPGFGTHPGPASDQKNVPMDTRGLPSPEQISIDVAFRVIADHIRTLSFAIADGIQPSNEGRGYVLRRILRRAVRYGRTLGFHEPFFYKLVHVLADTMGDVFPEIRAKQNYVEEVIQREEEQFNRTLDDGLAIFQEYLSYKDESRNYADKLGDNLHDFARRLELSPGDTGIVREIQKTIDAVPEDFAALSWKFKRLKAGLGILLEPLTRLVAEVSELKSTITSFFSETGPQRDRYSALIREQLYSAVGRLIGIVKEENPVPAKFAFTLYDTYGFPLDLTELMARECGLIVDKVGFENLMEEQKARARAAQKKEIISLSEIGNVETEFVGYDRLEADCRVLNTSQTPEGLLAVVDVSPLYAEMGGQVGDTGDLTLEGGKARYRVLNTVKRGHAHVLKIQLTDEEPWSTLDQAPAGHLRVDAKRRNAIQRHHTVTHLLHWALHEVVSKEASQKGSFVGPDKLTFDFNSQPLTTQQIVDIEKLVNERILENAGVSWTEVPYNEIKGRKDVMQFFGEKYGDTVRVVQIGGQPRALDGYSMELCGGTHTRATGEIGLFRIIGESAIAAGVRRIEAVAGLEAYRKATDEVQLIKTLACKVNSPVHELEKKIESLLAHQKALEKEVKLALLRNASNAASELLGRIQNVNGIPLITHNLGDANGDFLQALADALKGRFKGVVVLGGASDGAVTLVASVSSEFTSKVQAGKLIQQIAPIVGGKGGGKPDNARGGGKDAAKLDEALAKVKTLLG
jgi:alanyl-tRNA synthetase